MWQRQILRSLQRLSHFSKRLPAPTNLNTFQLPLFLTPLQLSHFSPSSHFSATWIFCSSSPLSSLRLFATHQTWEKWKSTIVFSLCWFSLFLPSLRLKIGQILCAYAGLDKMGKKYTSEPNSLLAMIANVGKSSDLQIKLLLKVSAFPSLPLANF